MSSPTKAVLTLSLNIPAGETPKEVRDRIEKFFTYYHPRYEAQVSLDKSVHADDASTPAADDDVELTPELCELLGIDPAALSLLD